MADLVIPDSGDDGLLFTAFLEALEADPLSTYRHATEGAKKLVEACQRVHELWSVDIALRGGNGSGKTYTGAALGVALARGLTELGGTPLPKMPVPNVGWVMVQTRMQQVDASQKAYLHWLGKHPHKISYVSGEGKGYIERIDVATAKCKHGMDKRCETCSRIMFHCAESDSSIGGRIHWAHGDELPPGKLWGEVRARFTAGVPFLRFLTYTPLFVDDWEWIAKEFKDCQGVWNDRRIEFRATIFDNRFISAEQAEAVVSQWTDHYREARINGEFVDTRGDCPFDVPRLLEWKKRCEPPTVKERHITVQTVTHLGAAFEPRIARIEVWDDPQPEDSYVLVADPSTGVRSANHDPAGFQVWSRLRRRLVARFDDYLEPYGLGWLISLVAQEYNLALVDVDMTGGYGGPTITALGNLQYRNINRDYMEFRPGTHTSQLGFRITAEGRQEITTAIQRALAEQSADVPSEAVLKCLLGCVVDSKGKSLAGPGGHDEDMICMGRALHLMDTLGKPMARVITPREKLYRAIGRGMPLSLPPEEDEADAPLVDSELA